MLSNNKKLLVAKKLKGIDETFEKFDLTVFTEINKNGGSYKFSFKIYKDYFWKFPLSSRICKNDLG